MAKNGIEKNSLSPGQLKAIEGMLRFRKQEQVCEFAEVSKRQLARWFQEDAFQSALRQAESAALQQIGRNLIVLADKATDTLEDALDPGERTNHRLMAADIITDRLIKLRDAIEIESRLAALEKRLNDEQLSIAVDQIRDDC